jgi:hypothetical protein
MLNAYSVDDIIIIQSGGYDEWNNPLEEIEISIKGYAEWKTSLVRNIKGEQVASSIKLTIRKKALDTVLTKELSHEDRIKSINEIEIDKPIINIHQPKAFSNPHYEIYLA